MINIISRLEIHSMSSAPRMIGNDHPKINVKNIFLNDFSLKISKKPISIDGIDEANNFESLKEGLKESLQAINMHICFLREYSGHMTSILIDELQRQNDASLDFRRNIEVGNGCPDNLIKSLQDKIEDCKKETEMLIRPIREVVRFLNDEAQHNVKNFVQKSELDFFNTEFQKLNNIIKQYQEQYQKQDEKIDFMLKNTQAQNEKMRNHFQMTTNHDYMLTNHNQKIGSIWQNIEKKDAEIKLMRQDMDRQNIVLDKVSEYQKKLFEYQNQITQTQGERMDRQSQRIDLSHEKIDDVAKTIQEKDQIIKEQGRTINSQGQTITSLLNEVRNMTNEMQNMKDEMRNHIGQRNIANNKLAEKDQIIDEHGRTINSQGQTITFLLNEVRNMTNEMQNMKDEMRNNIRQRNITDHRLDEELKIQKTRLDAQERAIKNQQKKKRFCCGLCPCPFF